MLRLTIRATCVMNLADFPMDKQRCPLKIGSCKYSIFLVHFIDGKSHLVFSNAPQKILCLPKLHLKFLEPENFSSLTISISETIRDFPYFTHKYPKGPGENSPYNCDEIFQRPPS